MPESARRGAARAWSIDYGVRDLTAGGNEMHVIRLAGSVVAQVASGNVEMIRACHLFCRSGNCGRSDRRSAGASASHPGFERRPGMSWHRAAGARSVRKRRTGPCFLKMRPKRTGHAPNSSTNGRHFCRRKSPIASASKWAEWRATPISSAAWKWRKTLDS